tara:strand:+ start:166 stop:576 length:411 start_codon:yes stop_codon:yes gene_type:complete
MTLQEKIVAMAMWKGMSQRYFPTNQLLNQANAVELQKMGSQMFNFTEMGALPMGQMPQLPAVPANNGPIKVQLEDGTVVQGTLHTEKPEDKLSILTDAVYALKDEVAKLRGYSTNQNRRIRELEAIPQPAEKVAKK